MCIYWFLCVLLVFCISSFSCPGAKRHDSPAGSSLRRLFQNAPCGRSITKCTVEDDDFRYRPIDFGVRFCIKSCIQAQELAQRAPCGAIIFCNLAILVCMICFTERPFQFFLQQPRCAIRLRSSRAWLSGCCRWRRRFRYGR